MDAIAVGIDFSKTSLAAMRLAGDIAVRAKADLYIIWVETVEEDLETAETKLQNFTKELQQKLPENKVSYRIVNGRKVYTALNAAFIAFCISGEI